MPAWLIGLYMVHILAALFWIGSSFLTVQARGKGAEKQFRWQMLAALITFACGGYLWWMFHWPLFGPMEAALALGVFFAVMAAGVQGMLVGGSLRKLRGGVMPEAQARKRIILGERIGAGLGAMALLSMVGSYHMQGLAGIKIPH